MAKTIEFPTDVTGPPLRPLAGEFRRPARDGIRRACHESRTRGRDIAPTVFDYGVLGFGAAEDLLGNAMVHGMIDRVTGPTIGQACATGVRTVLTAAHEIQSGLAAVALVVTADRTSNGPHLYYPNPQGPGGTGAHEDWVMDNFSYDPYTTLVDAGDRRKCRQAAS